MMNSSNIRTSFLVSGIVVCCIIGLPNLYDKFLIPRYIATAVGLAILFLFALVTKKRGHLPDTPVFIPYLLTALISVFSILWATNTAEAVFSASLQVMGFLTTLTAYTLFTGKPLAFKKTLWISSAIILTAYLLFAFVQLFHIENLSFGQLYQVTGICGHKNLLSIMLFMLSAFLLTAIPYTKSRLLKVIPITLFVISITLVSLLKSRAVAISALLATLLFVTMAILHRKRPRFSKGAKTATLVTTLVLTIAFFTTGLRWFATRGVPHTAEKSEVEYNPLSTSSLSERCLLWEKTYQISNKRPFFGYGAGNWQIHFPDAGLEGLYRADVWNVNFTKPHNEYLGMMAECGYVGLFAFLCFLCPLLALSFFAVCETNDKKEFLFGAIILSVFMACCVNALFDFPNSRIEHLVWSSILVAILFHIISQNKPKPIGKAWNYLFLLLAALMVVIGGFRLNGERNSFALQQAMRQNDWNAMERYSRQALSPFYTIDPEGVPLRWFQGKAEKRMGNPKAIEQFRIAWHDAPYFKENLNDLGLAEYYEAHDPAAAEHDLNEAIRISPNYLQPFFNLAKLYLHQNKPAKARAVVDRIYMDEHKRDVLIHDIPFFEPQDIEATRQKIETDYETTMELRRMINKKRTAVSHDKAVPGNTNK